MTDAHEVRMAAGQASALLMDILDDEAIELMIPVAASLVALVDHLEDKGLPTKGIAQFLSGIAIGAATHDLEGGEGEGPS